MNGFERLQELGKEINSPISKFLLEYLLTCKHLEKFFMKEEKTFKDLIKYVEYTALKKCEKDQRKIDNTNVKYASTGFKDTDLYALATTYFIFSNEKLGIDRIDMKNVISNISSVAPTPSNTKIAKKTTPTVEKTTKNKADTNQVSLF